MGIPDHLTCLLRTLYAGQEATVRTGHGTTDWFQIGKGVRQGYILSPCLFNLCAEYIMRNAGLEETQAGIKIARRNISNLRYADDTTLMAESEEELKSLLMNVKEESEKVVLKLNILQARLQQYVNRELPDVQAVMAIFMIAGYNGTSYYPSTADLQASLTLSNSSSSEFTLKTMAIVSLIIPFVLAYIAYFWRQMDKKSLTKEELETGEKY